jgi:hypothetical protein
MSGEPVSGWLPGRNARLLAAIALDEVCRVDRNLVAVDVLVLVIHDVLRGF